MNMVKCKVDNRWGWEPVDARLIVYSPAGGHVLIYKRCMAKLTKEEQNLVWAIAIVPTKSGESEVQLTIEQMKQLVHIGLKSGVVHKPKGLAQRKAEWRKRNPNAGKQCGCGGTIIQKDHGTWIGWHCPKCSAGGSKRKK